VKARITPFDYSNKYADVRVLELRLYRYAKLIGSSAEFFKKNAVLSGLPLADWRTGDFERVGFLSSVDAQGKLSFEVQISFEDKKHDAESILFLPTIAKRDLIIQYVDDCDVVTTVGPMRLETGKGDSSEITNLGVFSLNFVRTTRKPDTTEVLNDAIVAVSVSCDIPIAGIPKQPTVQTNELRIVTFVECEI
jgi:hypothetical protein